MTTTSTITEAELLANPEFVAWCDTWQEQGRCPLVMADWMLDTYGDERMYRAARWAWAKEERVGCRGAKLLANSRAIPRSNYVPTYCWWKINESQNAHSDDVPVTTRGGSLTSFDSFPTAIAFFDSFPAAIAFYFVHFDLELAERYPPKDEVWT